MGEAKAQGPIGQSKDYESAVSDGSPIRPFTGHPVVLTTQDNNEDNDNSPPLPK